MLYLPVILGTGREGRVSAYAADFILQQVKVAGHETELIDVRDFPSPFTARVDQEDWDAKGLDEKMARADGYVIVTPEYNHGYPGELKIFIDHFYQEYDRKVIGLCGVSNGPWGGTRCIEQLRGAFGAVNVMIPKQCVMFPRAGKLFGETGQMNAEDSEKYAKAAAGMIEEVAWFASSLKGARKGSK